MADRMRVLAGTSGFSYKEWRGSFYPDKIAPKAMLGCYAARLPIVEINNTFYRLPTVAMLAGWREQVSDEFRFAIKAPRRLTHVKRLRDCDSELRALFDAVVALAPCLGSILFQLPPFFRCDCDVLQAFTAALPDGVRAAFEFRHDSWLVPEVFELLRSRGLALVLSETDDGPLGDLPWTADWAYLRLRKTAYSEAELEAWVQRLRAAGLVEAQVFFKHEDAGVGPRLAQRFLEIAGAGPGVSRDDRA